MTRSNAWPYPAVAQAAFRRFCEFGGLGAMADDPRFQERGLAMYGAPMDDVRALRQGIEVVIASHTKAEWESWFAGEQDFVWSQVQDHGEIMQDEQARANEYVVPIQLPHLDEIVPVVGNVIGLSESPGKVRVGLGRIVVSEIEVPNMSVNMV
jgi:crotonobetainyl-CoA:carnitine CoA-transferase CaiB-like acyl-CoA transferase